MLKLKTSKLAQLGINPNAIASVLSSQNAMNPSGMIETASDNVYVRMSGQFDDIDAIRNLAIRVDEKSFRLGDIAKVERKYVEPAEPMMFYNGEPAIGVALSMAKGGNII